MTVLKEYKGSGDPADAANWETIVVGSAGPAGTPGPPGQTGPTGDPGATGPPPTTVSLTRAAWQALSPPNPTTIYIITDEGGVMLSGTTAPTAGLGFNGDFYLDSVAWLIYGPKTTGGWGSGTSIKGPTGPTGPSGSVGTHASTHSAGNADPVQITEGQVTNLVTDLGVKVNNVQNVTGIWSGNQAAYDAIGSKVSSTLYIIV